jgi:hypothetical protein
MFTRLATISAAEEKPEIFSLLMVGLGLMAHIMFLFGLAMGVMVALDLPFAKGASPLATILILGASADIFRFPVIAARSQARRAFGLDPRPFGARFRGLALRELIGFVLIAGLSYGILSLLGRISLVAWSAILFFIVQAFVFAPPIYRRLEPKIFPERFRAIRDGELPDNFPKIIQALPLPKNWSIHETLVRVKPSWASPWPKALGHRLIVPENALKLPVGALRHRLVTAILGRLVKAEGLIVILRALTMSLSVPLALVFLGGLGFLWRFPQSFSPILVPCLWLAVGVSHFVSRAMVRFVRRLLERKLSAAAVLATWDVPGFKASLEAASRFDLEPDGNPWWFWFSRNRPGAIEQIEQIKDQLQILAKLQTQAQENARKKAHGQDPGGEEANA